MNKWIDISMAIKPDMMVYKERIEKKPEFIARATHEEKGYCESSLKFDLHSGTHIDMPLHMIDKGQDSSTFNVASVNGTCLVIDLHTLDHADIQGEDLQGYDIKEGDIVLLKTRNSYAEHFDVNFDYVAESGAAYLVSRGIKAVGIDGLGIERSQSDHMTHIRLLSVPIYIIEGLSLAHVTEGRYELICLPLKIEGVEGLPARAYLIPDGKV
jgi:arylformamidase